MRFISQRESIMMFIIYKHLIDLAWNQFEKKREQILSDTIALRSSVSTE